MGGAGQGLGQVEQDFLSPAVVGYSPPNLASDRDLSIRQAPAAQLKETQASAATYEG